MQRTALIALSTILLAAGGAVANDEPTDGMTGKVTVVKAGKLLKFVAKPPVAGAFDLPDAGNAPTAEGASLRIVDLGDPTNADLVIALPVQAAPLGWKGLGSPAGATGYKYKGAGSAADPCKVVLVKEKIVKAVCKGPAVDLDQPLNGALAVVLTVGTNSKNYCAVFGGAEAKNDDATTKRRNAAAPACTCGAVPPKTLHLTNGVGVGTCGTLTGGSINNSLVCAGLYTGGGLVTTTQPSITPDSANPLILNVDCCAGDTLILSATTDAESGGQQNSCTKTGCFFGAPVPLPSLMSTPTSACVVNTIARDMRGEIDCTSGFTRLDVPLNSAVFLTGDTLVNRCSGGSNPGGRCPTPGADPVNCPGGTCTADPDLQPCPICNPTTLLCNGGINNGMACVPDGGSGTGLSRYPTSHDCPVFPIGKVGDLPVPFLLTSGTQTKTAAASGGQARVFCGFCRDADNTLGFGICAPGSSTNAGGVCSVKDDCCADPMAAACINGPNNCSTPAKRCASDADCAGDLREACEQRSEGAFDNGAATVITEIGAPSGNIKDYGPHSGTQVSVFCIPPTFNGIIDNSGDLPGPGATSLPGVVQIFSPSGAFTAAPAPF